VHGSWRRAVVVALVRSELSADVLTCAEEYLLADSGRLLRDLVRTLMAVDVVPASRLLAGSGVNLPDEIAAVDALQFAKPQQIAWVVGAILR
jgi:hypothetical protein